MIIDLEKCKALRSIMPQPIGLCVGCFDLIHSGHIEHFVLAKSMCVTLVVSVTPDQFVTKGPGRPYYNHQDRARIVNELRCVDYVLCDNWDDRTGMTAIRHVKPTIYFKGLEYASKSTEFGSDIYNEVSLVESLGGRTEFVSGQVFSSTALLTQLGVLK